MQSALGTCRWLSGLLQPKHECAGLPLLQPRLRRSQPSLLPRLLRRSLPMLCRHRHLQATPAAAALTLLHPTAVAPNCGHLSPALLLLLLLPFELRPPRAPADALPRGASSAAAIAAAATQSAWGSAGLRTTVRSLPSLCQCVVLWLLPAAAAAAKPVRLASSA